MATKAAPGPSSSRIRRPDGVFDLAGAVEDLPLRGGKVAEGAGTSLACKWLATNSPDQNTFDLPRKLAGHAAVDLGISLARVTNQDEATIGKGANDRSNFRPFAPPRAMNNRSTLGSRKRTLRR